jgi:uncharacterized phage protein (TIGR02220 family)
MGAGVTVEDFAFSDDRYEVLAQLAGLADPDHARGKMIRLWRTCTLRQSHVLPETLVRVVVDPQAVIDAELAERVDGANIRIRGTVSRIEWYGDLRESRVRAGKARAQGAQREGGRFTSTTSTSPADDQHPPAAVQHATSTRPAPTSAPTTTTAPSSAPAPAEEPGAGMCQPRADEFVLAEGTGVGTRPKLKRPARGPTPDELATVERVLGKLSERARRSYSPDTQAHAKLVLRLLRDGHSERDLRLVVWDRGNAWADDPKMDPYLRPSTLFGPQKFPEYLAEATAAREAHERQHGDQQPRAAPAPSLLVLSAMRNGGGR